MLPQGVLSQVSRKPVAGWILRFAQLCLRGRVQVALACARGKGLLIDEKLNPARQPPDYTA